MKKYIPILDWLPKYNTSNLKNDLIAGFTVGVILIPQGIAYATIAGLPPIYGLYTALIPQVIYAIFGTSRQLATGPIAIDSLIIATGISSLATVGTENFIAIALVLTLFVGTIQVIVGFFKLGFIVNFLSKPVLIGFITAAVFIIGLNQFKGLLSIDIERSNHIHKLIVAIFKNIPQIHLQSFLLGFIAILMIIFLKKINKKIPSALIVVILSILTVKFFNAGLDEVKIVGKIPEGLPPFKMPEFNYDLLYSLFPLALTLSFTGFLQVISIAKAFEEEDAIPKLDANQELLAIGMSNIVGSMFSSYTTSASFSRSAINKEAGAQTAMSSIFSALFIMLALLFLTPVFYNLPISVLSAIIIVAVFNLIKIDEIIYLWKTNKQDFIMMLITFIVTLTIGIKEGIFTGVLVSIFMVVFDTSKPHMAVLGKVPNSEGIYRNISRFEDVENDEEILIVRFDARLYFANANYFKDKIDEFAKAKGDKLRLIIIDAQAMNNIDSTGLNKLEVLVNKYNEKGIFVYLTAIKGPVRDAFSKCGFFQNFGLENCFMNIQEAINCYKEGDFSYNNKHKKYLNQSNL